MLQLNVIGMTCGHCVKAVTQAVRKLPGAGEVSVDLNRGLVTVAGSADPASGRAAIRDEGYPPPPPPAVMSARRRLRRAAARVGAGNRQRADRWQQVRRRRR